MSGQPLRLAGVAGHHQGLFGDREFSAPRPSRTLHAAAEAATGRVRLLSWLQGKRDLWVTSSPAGTGFVITSQSAGKAAG